MAHCTGKLCPFEERGKFINVRKVPESLQVRAIFGNGVRCWRKNVPILSVFFLSLSPSLAFCYFIMLLHSLSLFPLCPCLSLSIYFLLYSSPHIAWMPLSHPPPLRTHASWGILIGWSFKGSSVGEWVAVWLEGVRQTAPSLCSNAGAPRLGLGEYLKWASTLFLSSIHSNQGDSWECFTMLISALSYVSSH